MNFHVGEVDGLMFNVNTRKDHKCYLCLRESAKVKSHLRESDKIKSIKCATTDVRV